MVIFHKYYCKNHQNEDNGCKIDITVEYDEGFMIASVSH